MIGTNMRVRILPTISGDLEGLYKSYDIKLGEVYPVLGFGEKVIIRVGNRMIDVFPSRLEIVD
jgi:hypothetical protein